MIPNTVNDFDVMLRDLGMTAELVQKLTDIQTDRVGLPLGDYKFMIGPSDIEGQGVFATADIQEGEVIGPVRIGLGRTVLGYRTNHSGSPNAETVGGLHGSGNLVALRPISCGDEITIDYRHAIVEAARAETAALAGNEVLSAWKTIEYLVEEGSPRQAMREAIDLLEGALAKLPQAGHDIEHLFTDGLYIRSVRIQQGTLFVTPIYKEECILTMLCGRLVIVTEDGASVITPPHFVLTKSGAKRAIFAVDEVLAHTVHPNPDNERDISVLEARIYASAANELAGGML